MVVTTTIVSVGEDDDDDIDNVTTTTTRLLSRATKTNGDDGIGDDLAIVICAPPAVYERHGVGARIQGTAEGAVLQVAVEVP